VTGLGYVCFGPGAGLINQVSSPLTLTCMCGGRIRGEADWTPVLVAILFVCGALSMQWRVDVAVLQAVAGDTLLSHLNDCGQ
jgi:hypothetical protein